MLTRAQDIDDAGGRRASCGAPQRRSTACFPPRRNRRLLLAACCIASLMSACNQKADAWSLYEDKSELDGTTSTFALKSFPISGGGVLETKAVCDTGSLDFQFTYLNDDAKGGNGPALLWTQQGYDSAVLVRTRLDGDDIVTVPSRSDYQNVATAYFYDKEGLWFLLNRPFAADSDRTPSGNSPEQVRRNLRNLFGKMALSLGFPAVIDAGAGPVEDFNSAKTLSAEIPLSDGRKAVARIERDDPVFRTFLDGCRKQGLQALAFSRSNPRPVCTAGDKLLVKEGAVALKPDSAEPLGQSFEAGDVVTVERQADDVPPTVCRVRVRALTGRSVVVSVSRSSLQTQAEWDKDHAVDLDKAWKGPAAEFEAALRQKMAKCARDLDIDPRRYDADIAYVVNYVTRCASITDAAYQKTRDYTGHYSVGRLGPEYKTCGASHVNVAKELGRPPKDEPRGLVIWPTVGRIENRSGGFSAMVTVIPKDTDPRPGPGALFHHFGVIDAQFPLLP